MLRPSPEHAKAAEATGYGTAARRPTGIAVSPETMLAAAAVLISVVAYLGTRRLEIRLRRADLMQTYTTEFHSSPQLRTMFLEIIYERLSIDDEFYGTDRELDLLYLLDQLNVVGYLCRSRVLRFREIVPSVIGYAAIRTWDNQVVRDYLEHVRVLDHAGGYAAVSGFPYFERLGRRLSKLRTNPVPVATPT